LKLKELNAIKNEFVSIVSHDLKIPLTSIICHSKLLLHDEAIKSNEQHNEYISMISKAGERQMNLIENLLNLSMLESGKMHVLMEKFNISKAIAEIITEIKFKLTEKEITLRNNVPCDVVVSADEQRIKQVIANLLNNAIKFTPENGNITITLSQEKEHLQIAVQDSGIGIIS